MNWQLLQAGFPLTVIPVEERARYLGALDQGHAGASSAVWNWSTEANEAASEHAGGSRTGNLLPLQTFLALSAKPSDNIKN